MTASAGELCAWIIWPVVLVVCCAFDALYCGLETGIYVMNKVRLDLDAEAGSRAAKYIKKALGESNNTLAVLLIGTNFARYLATFAITSMFVLGGAGEWAELYTVLVATPFIFVIGDAVPKAIFQRVADRGVRALYGLLRASDVAFKVLLLSPLVRLSSGLLLRLSGAGRAARAVAVSEGIRPILAEGRAAGALTGYQSAMAERIVGLARVSVSSAMVPMRRVVRARQDADRAALLRLYRRQDYSRIPLLDAEGKVAGVLDMYDALTAPPWKSPAELATSALRLDAETSVNDALYRMQRAHAVLAVVADPSGRDVGLVTIKDLVEEIVGEIRAW